MSEAERKAIDANLLIIEGIAAGMIPDATTKAVIAVAPDNAVTGGTTISAHWGDVVPGGDTVDDEWRSDANERVDFAACWTSDPPPYDNPTPEQAAEFNLDP